MRIRFYPFAFAAIVFSSSPCRKVTHKRVFECRYLREEKEDDSLIMISRVSFDETIMMIDSDLHVDLNEERLDAVLAQYQ